MRGKDKREKEKPSRYKCIHTKNTETKSAGRQKAVWLLQPCNAEVTFQRVKQAHSFPCTEQKLFQAIASFMKYSTRPIKTTIAKYTRESPFPTLPVKEAVNQQAMGSTLSSRGEDVSPVDTRKHLLKGRGN